MKAWPFVGFTILTTGSMLTIQGAAGQDSEERQPEIRERIVEQLERTQARILMLER